MSALYPMRWCLLALLLVNFPYVHARSVPRSSISDVEPTADPKILILGGGVAGVIAARTFYEQGITNFVIVEARGTSVSFTLIVRGGLRGISSIRPDELGGRLQSQTIGAPGRELVVEYGANWVQGTQAFEDGPENPIWSLVKKHDMNTTSNDWSGSMSTFSPNDVKCLPLTSIMAYSDIRREWTRGLS